MASRSTSKPFPGFDKIFALEEPGTSSAFRVNTGLESDEALTLTRAEMQPTRPVVLTWAMGRAKPVEIIRTTMGTPVIISDSVAQLLRSRGFTGWSLYDVQVRGKQGESISGYRGLSFSGRCGPIDRSMSIQVPRIRPAGIFPVHIGVLFDPATWDGSDFFMPEGKNGWKFVVQEVKDAFEKAKVRNVEFTRLDQVELHWL